MISKGQVQGVERGDVQAQAQFVCQIFGVEENLRCTPNGFGSKTIRRATQAIAWL